MRDAAIGLAKLQDKNTLIDSLVFNCRQREKKSGKCWRTEEMDRFLSICFCCAGQQVIKLATSSIPAKSINMINAGVYRTTTQDASGVSWHDRLHFELPP